MKVHIDATPYEIISIAPEHEYEVLTIKLEHSSDALSVLQSCQRREVCRILDEEGYLVISFVPNSTPYINLITNEVKIYGDLHIHGDL